MVYSRVETRLGHPGHVLSMSSKSDPVAHLTRIILHRIMCALIMDLGLDQSNELSVLDSDVYSDVGSVSPDSKNILMDWQHNQSVLIIQFLNNAQSHISKHRATITINCHIILYKSQIATIATFHWSLIRVVLI